MNLLDKIQQERVSREHNKQVANQMLYIFDDYQDHDIYENIHAAVDYMVSYKEAFEVKVPRHTYVYHISLSSVFDPENMIKLDRKRKVSKLTIILQDKAQMCDFKLFECYIEINNSNFNESTLDINIVHAAKGVPPVTYIPTTFGDVYDAINSIRVQAARKYPPFDKMYADSSVLGELLVRFFTDVDDKVIKTEGYELELK
jgi:hypothetical protein